MLPTNIDKAIEIQPTNVEPKGLMKFTFYFITIIGIPTFLMGGFLLVIFGIWALFIHPKNFKKNHPATYTLTELELIAYGANRQIAWSIPWCDLENIYIVSMENSWQKLIGLRLKSFSNYRASIERSQVKGVTGAVRKAFSNKKIMQLSRLLSSKSDIIISYQTIDRPVNDFAQLLYIYMENYGS